MATIFDLGLFESLTPIFVLIFVFVILYATFQKFKIFGESSGLSALIAVALALLFITVSNLRDLITFFVPWVAVFFILLIIILVAVMLLGFSQKDIIGYLTDNPGATTAVIVVVIVIFLIAINMTFPGSIGYPSDSNGFSDDIRKIIFHPKVLGLILILVITGFVVRHAGFQK